MSQDGGIYILKAIDKYRKEGRWLVPAPFTSYRVAHVQGIDQFTYLEQNEPYNVGCYLRDTWGHSKVYDSLETAMQKAIELSKGYFVLEYGIQVIETEYVFYT